MILDREALQQAVARGERVRYRFFWGHRPRKDGAISDSCFSQWWESAFTVEGQRYASAEHFMMAEKARLFGDPETRAKVLATDDPSYAKKLGRQVRGFDENVWTEARFLLVTRGNLAKFEADEALQRYLLSTRDEVLVEASPTDRIWGIGLARADAGAEDPQAWRGLNLLGFALMRTRAILRHELPRPT
jgi:ribA/ribD-fused uncharacterized protein